MTMAPYYLGGKSWREEKERFAGKLISKAEKLMQSLFDIITQIRNLRSSIEIRPDEEVEVSLAANVEERADVGVTQMRGGTRLALEAGAINRISKQLWRQDFLSLHPA
jgi:valyl-tRNA synthetase